MSDKNMAGLAIIAIVLSGLSLAITGTINLTSPGYSDLQDLKRDIVIAEESAAETKAELSRVHKSLSRTLEDYITVRREVNDLNNRLEESTCQQ